MRKPKVSHVNLDARERILTGGLTFATLSTLIALVPLAWGVYPSTAFGLLTMAAIFVSTGGSVFLVSKACRPVSKLYSKMFKKPMRLKVLTPLKPSVESLINAAGRVSTKASLFKPGEISEVEELLNLTLEALNSYMSQCDNIAMLNYSKKNHLEVKFKIEELKKSHCALMDSFGQSEKFLDKLIEAHSLTTITDELKFNANRLNELSSSLRTKDMKVNFSPLASKS